MTRNYEKSSALFERAKNVLAGGVSSEFRKFSYPHALFFERAAGSRIWDVDGNELLDFTLSQGPLILGHSHPHVLETVERVSRDGQLFAGQHRLELELAEKLQALIPCAERLRFSLSGSEADHAALRLARAVTGRPRFVRFEGQYHGWLDNVAFGIGGSSEAALGPRESPDPQPWTAGLPERVLDEAIVLPWNDLPLLRRVIEKRKDEIAAIITEPVMCNSGCISPEPGFLEGLRELCDRHGIVLIFDEVITGFRLGLGGAQAYFGVTPDLAVFGKAMASGYPISVLAGRAKYMDWISSGRVVHAGTMNSGQPSVAAAWATIEVLEREAAHPRLFRLGSRLRDGLKAAAKEAGVPLRVQGPGPMFHAGFVSKGQEGEPVRDLRDTFRYDKALYARFVAGMQEAGIRLIGRGLWYVSNAHTEEEIDRAIVTAGKVFEGMKAA